MPNKTEYPLETICKALAMYVIGKTLADIQEETGVHREPLYALLRVRNMPLRHEAKSRRLLDPEQMQNVVELYRRGVKVKDIVRQLSIGRSLVYTILHECGIKMTVNNDGKTSTFTPEQEKEIVWLYDNSRISAPQIASMFGSSVTPVYQALREAGVQRHGWSGPKKHFVKYAAANGRMCRFQSTWEETFAKHLDGRGLDWAHESHTWLLSDGTSYTPDFWIPDWKVFVEIKGLMHDEALRKISLFRAEYPHLRLLVLNRHALSLYGIKLMKPTLVA